MLSECDREQFQKKEISLSPGAKEKIYIQKFYLYLNLTKPTKFLYPGQKCQERENLSGRRI